MNTIFKKVLTSALAAVTAVSAMSLSISAETTDDFQDLSAAEITDAMGAGYNVGNQLEASNNKVPNETVWGNPKITQETFHMIKEAGFKSVRIPVSYLSKIGEGPDYTVDEAWLNRVQEVVDYAIAEDLYVIINMHGDGYYTVDGGWLLVDDDDQEGINAKFGSLWTQIAETFKDYDEHLIFESMNEVFDGGYDNGPTAEQYDRINTYNQTFVDAVRATGGNNEKRWVLVPGWNTNIEYTTGDYGFEIPSDEGCTADGNRIMVSVHYYDPYDFCLNEKNLVKTQWGKEAEFAHRGGVETAVDNDFAKLYEAFTSKGYPVVIGELGCIDKSKTDPLNAESRARWLSYVVSTARELGCVPVYWDNGWNGDNGFGLFNRKDYSVTQPELIDAIMAAAETPSILPGDDSSSEPDSSEASESETSEPEESESSEEPADSTASSEEDSIADVNTSSNVSEPTDSKDEDKVPNTGASAAAAAVIVIAAGAGMAIAKSKRK